MTELATHPLAEIFPLIDEDSFVALKNDIAAHGLHEPIWFYEGQILDGRHRYRACRELELDCPTRSYTGDDPLGFMLSMNLQRRHLNESQRAMVAAKIATMRQGERTDVAPSANLQKVSQSKAADLVNISVRTLADAKKVQAEAQPEVIRAVEAGHIAVSAAAKLAQQPVRTQREVAAKVTSGAAKTVEQALKQVRGEANGRGGELQQPSPGSNGKTDAKRHRARWQHQLAELRQHFARLDKGERVEALVQSWDIAEASGYVSELGQLIEHLRHVHLRIMTVVSDQVDGNASFLSHSAPFLLLTHEYWQVDFCAGEGPTALSFLGASGGEERTPQLWRAVWVSSCQRSRRTRSTICPW
jgi:ParB-like chromosome segregation protein Spo0J